MAIWKLKPIDPNHRDWKTSTYRGEVSIRAESETRAREIAMSAFLIATEVIFGEKNRYSPWGQTMLVSAVEVQDDNYPKTGKEGIVGPQEALAYVDA